MRQGRLWTPELLGSGLIFDFSRRDTWTLNSTLQDLRGLASLARATGTSSMFATTLGTNLACGFFGNSGYHTTSANAWLQANAAAPITIFSVWRCDSLGGVNGLVQIGTSSVALESIRTRLGTGSVLVSNDSSTIRIGSAFVVGTEYLLVQTHDTSAPRHRFRFNGSSFATWASDDGGSLVSTTGALGIGWDAEGSNGMRGAIAAVCVIPGIISTLDAQNLEGWAAHKWGITARLPATHPFKNTPPLIGG